LDAAIAVPGPYWPHLPAPGSRRADPERCEEIGYRGGAVVRQEQRRDYETHHNQYRPHRSLHAAAPLKPVPEPVDLDQYLSENRLAPVP
jgi:hypothetical protein